jgi:hypothetical protein
MMGGEQPMKTISTQPSGKTSCVWSSLSTQRLHGHRRIRRNDGGGACSS